MAASTRLPSLPLLWPKVSLLFSHISQLRLLLTGASPFSAPRAKRAEADAARNKLRLAASDQITLIRTFELWNAAKNKGNEKRFCSDHWVSQRVMREVDKARSLFIRVLVNLNFHDGNEHGVANANRTSVPALQVKGIMFSCVLIRMLRRPCCVPGCIQMWPRYPEALLAAL